MTLVHLENLVPLVHLDLMALLDLLELLASLVIAVFPEHLEKMESLDHLALRDPEDLWEIKENVECLVNQVFEDLRVDAVCLDLKGREESKEILVLKVLPEKLDHQVLLALGDILALPDLSASLEKMETRVILDLLENVALRVTMV